MNEIEKNIELTKERKVLEALIKLSRESTQEIQRLQALKLAWSSRRRTDCIQRSWGVDYDTECGALLEFSNIAIPLTPCRNWINLDERNGKKKHRRAVYITAQCGHMVVESELFCINDDSIEIRFPDRISFSNVAPGFVAIIHVWGLNLPEKEKIKHLPYDAGFEVWAQCQLRPDDMTGKQQSRRLKLTSRAPPNILGNLELKLMGAVPTFCDVIREGFLNLWTEANGPEWKMLWVQLKNGKLRGSRDPAGRGAHAFEIVISSALKIQESTRKRPFSFQLRDFNGRTVLAASSKDEMNDWMKTIRKHKEHLKKWGKLETQETAGPNSNPQSPVNPWEKLFTGQSKVEVKLISKSNKTKRRSRSVDLKSPLKEETPTRVTRVRRNSGETPTKPPSTRPEWMIKQNKALPLISPVARYDPPTICLDKDESLAEDELNNGPGMDETVNDVLDKLEICERKPRRDTNMFHREILENTKKQAQRKHKPPSNKPVPLRTSTQMGDEDGIRSKYQAPLPPPEIDSHSPPQFARVTQKSYHSPTRTKVQSHAIQAHKSILQSPSHSQSPRAQNFINYKYVEEAVSNILADRFEESDDENWPPNQLKQQKRKKIGPTQI